MTRSATAMAALRSHAAVPPPPPPPPAMLEEGIRGLLPNGKTGEDRGNWLDGVRDSARADEEEEIRGRVLPPPGRGGLGGACSSISSSWL